jgi:hypothetical protein
VVSVVNNENGRRRPQAMIFEIIESQGKWRAVDVAQYTFEGSDIWTNYNDEDKTIEVHSKADGSGEILFPATKYGAESTSSGGQILAFDLNAIVQGQFQNALKPGAFLAGGENWIRRVFTNSEINRVNSFSDQALATFGEGSMTGTGTLLPAHVLELARNLRAYETLAAGSVLYGIQLISDYAWESALSQTTLRVVAADKADAEKPVVLDAVTFPGQYLSHLKEKSTGDLLVLSNSYSWNDSGRVHGEWSYKATSWITRWAVNAQGPQRIQKARTTGTHSPK